MTDPNEIDARASLFMREGIRLMQVGNDANAALLCFDRALDLRRRLPTSVPVHAYGLAACWLNRAEALTTLAPDRHADSLAAYDEALALLRMLPLSDDARFPRRLAIALQNRALVLVAQNPPATLEAAVALTDAIEVLNHADAMEASDREFLLATVWMNLANIQASESAARRALELVKMQEHEDAAAAAVGLKARHVLCQIAAQRLSVMAQGDTVMANVHNATDLADEGLALIREWERRGVDRFRNLASDLFRFGARIYAEYQPQFLQEFLSEQPDPQRQDAAREIAFLLPTS